MVKRLPAEKRTTEKKTLRVASDCSGLDAAAMALESLKLSYQEAWVSDTCPAARAVLAANFKPDVIYKDCKQVSRSKEAVDLYTAGSPCQSYSRLGKGEGLQSTNGQTLLLVLRNVAGTRPRTLLLENVADLMTQHEDTFKKIIQVLTAIKDPPQLIVSFTQVYICMLRGLIAGQVCAGPQDWEALLPQDSCGGAQLLVPRSAPEQDSPVCGCSACSCSRLPVAPA